MLPAFQLKNKAVIIAGLLGVLNILIKILYIDSNSIANDEPFSVFYAQLEIPAIIDFLKTGNNPPLFEILLHFWIKLFGISPFAVRFLPFLFSVATVILIFQIGRTFFSEKIGIIASLLFTFSNYHLYFAHEARVYSLFAFLSCFSFYFLFCLIKNPGKTKFWYGLTIINILLIYSHFFGFFLLFIQFASIIFDKSLRKVLFKNYLIFSGVVFLFYLPYLPYFVSRFFQSSSQGTWLEPASITDAYLAVWKFSNQPVSTVIFLIILLSATIKFFFKKQQAGVFVRLTVIWFFLPLVVMLLISLDHSFKIPMFLDRYLIFFSIAWYFLIAIASDYIFSDLRFRKWLIPIPVILMLATFNLKADNKRDVENMVKNIQNMKDEKTAVYLSPEWFDINFTYYYNRPSFRADVGSENPKSSLIQYLQSENIYPITNYEQVTVDTQLIHRVVFLDFSSEWNYPENNIYSTLSSIFPKQTTIEDFGVYKIHMFEK